jgi:hypothetical protein
MPNRLTFWPAADSSASWFTFSNLLSLNPLIPGRSLTSANNDAQLSPHQRRPPVKMAA